MSQRMQLVAAGIAVAAACAFGASAPSAAAPGQGAAPAAAAQGRGAEPAAPQGGAGRGAPAPQSPRDSAPIDLTGYWVSVVNEDWRWRMVTPPKGDYASVPLNAEARKVADAWDPSKDGSCEAYGAAGVMRIPTRLNISWEDAVTLKIETDAGRQTRRLLFDAARKPGGPPSLQGHSVAEWERPGGGGRGGGGAGRGGAAPGGTARVTTTNLRGGWLRKNGVPYSEGTTLTEYFDRFAAPNGDEWLVVTTIVADAKYLTQDFITSTHFKKEPDGSKFAPVACR